MGLIYYANLKEVPRRLKQLKSQQLYTYLKKKTKRIIIKKQPHSNYKVGLLLGKIIF